MNRERLMGIVTGAHILVIGGLLLSQGCGTTRAPLPPEEEYVMPPSVQEETYVPPVPSDPLPPPPAPPAVEPVVVTPPADTTTYVVRKGDALSVIAKRYGVSLQEVMRINNITNPDKIRVGQKLALPGNINVEQPAESGGSSTSEEAAPTSTPTGDRYVVQSGDSLSEIAQRTGTDIKVLQKLNNISDANMIRVGQELRLPSGTTGESAPARETSADTVTTPEVTPEPEPVPTTAETNLLPPAPSGRAAPQTYTVEIGDDLISVASEFNVSIAALREVNDLESNILVPGRTLIIPDVDE